MGPSLARNPLVIFTGPTALRSYALPDSDATIAVLAGVQTFTGLKTLTDGFKLGSTSTFITGASNLVTLHNGASIQTFRVTETYTDESNYKGILIEGYNASFVGATIRVAKAGAGANERLFLIGTGVTVYGGAGTVILSTNNTSRVIVTDTDTAIRNGLLYTPQAIANGNGAVDLITPQTTLAANGAHTLTLANGINGQVKEIDMISTTGGGVFVLTPTTKTGFSTITFAAATDHVRLKYHTVTGWIIADIRGAIAA